MSVWKTIKSWFRPEVKDDEPLYSPAEMEALEYLGMDVDYPFHSWEDIMTSLILRVKEIENKEVKK